MMMKTEKIPHKATVKDENGIRQSEGQAPEATVKHEEEGQSLGIMINSETEGQKDKDEDHESFKVLEKGDIFFFYRHRVNDARAHGIHDVARSFIVLRPASSQTVSVAKNSSTGFGATFRLLVVPKKVLPTFGGMKEMGFVEKAQITLKELQDTFIAGFDYETQSYGTRTMPEAKLYAKGVYTITLAHRGSYLDYILTEPKKPGPVQDDFGLHERGSWLVQSKNPKVLSPPSVSLSDSPDYPESFGEVFGHYRWVPLRPELIDYPNAQFLLIGRSSQIPVTQEGVEQEEMESSQHQLDDLMHENEMREKQFRGVDSVYGDLGLEVCHHLKIPTTWDHE